MLNRQTVEYPALIYTKNKYFLADCVMFNLAAIGKTETEVINKLQNIMSKELSEFNIIIKPVYEKRYKVSL